MIWKLIKALVRRIRAWYEIKNHVNALLLGVENEIAQNKAKEHRREYEELSLFYLEQKRESLSFLAKHIANLEMNIKEKESI